MATKKTLYLPDKLFGFAPARFLHIEKHPEYGIEVRVENYKKVLVDRSLKMPSQYRDVQKTKVYRAEWALKGKINGRELNSIEDMREFLNESWDALDLKKGQHSNARYQIKRPTIKYHDKTGSCTAYHSGWIGMSRLDWAANRITVLHEMAHFLCPMSENHGPMFARTLLDLTTKFISPEVGGELFDNYLNGTERTRFKWKNLPAQPGARFSFRSEPVEKKMTTRPEVGAPHLGLARLGLQTGFSTGVPHNNLVSPIVARQIGGLI